MTNNANCTANSLADVPYAFSCGVPALSTSNTSSTTSSLLQSCCPQGAPVQAYPSSVDNANCYLYCNASTLTGAQTTYWCLGNLSVTHPNGSSGLEVFGCDLKGAGARMRWSSVGVLLAVGAWAVVASEAGVM